VRRALPNSMNWSRREANNFCVRGCVKVRDSGINLVAKKSGKC